MTIDITQIIVALIGLLLTVIGAVITKAVVPWIKTNTSETVQDIIDAAAETAVYAAQQLYSDNAEKKAYAENYIINLLAKYGLTFDTDTVSGAIEGALKSIKLHEGDDWYSTID